MQPKRVKSGYSLFLEGDEAGYLYYIRSGRVKMTKSTEDGKEIILSIQQKGPDRGIWWHWRPESQLQCRDDGERRTRDHLAQ